jgi:WD40 repeat protein
MLQFRKHNLPIRGLAFSPAGAHLAACSEWALDVWTVATGAVDRCGRRHYGGSVQFDPSGRWLLAPSDHEGLFAIDTRTWTARRAGNFRASHIAVSPAGDRVVVGSPTLACFALQKDGIGDRRWLKNPVHHQFQGLDFFPSGNRFASVELYQFGFFSAPISYLRIRSAANGAVQSEFELGRNQGGPARVSPDGEWVAFLSTSYLVVQHATEPNRSVRFQTPNKNHLTGLAFHPSGRFLAATSNDHTVRLHDRDADWTVTRTFDWNIGKLKAVAFSPDGNLAAAGGEKGRIVVWDVDV